MTDPKTEVGQKPEAVDEAAALAVRAERVKEWIRDHNFGGACKMLSMGDDCICALCDVDELHFAARGRTYGAPVASHEAPETDALKAVLGVQEGEARDGALTDEQIDDIAQHTPLEPWVLEPTDPNEIARGWRRKFARAIARAAIRGEARDADRSPPRSARSACASASIRAGRPPAR